jgi:ABC-2 type transport system permease protein
VIGEISAIMGRELRKWVRSPPLLLMALIQPLFWMGLYGKAFNLTGLFNVPEEVLRSLPPESTRVVASLFNQMASRFFGSPGTDYFSFVATGMVSVIVLFVSVFSGMSIAWDRRLGFLNKLLVAPIRRSSIVLGKVLAASVRALVQATMVLLMGLALGMRLSPASPLLVAGAVASIFLLAVSLSSLVIAITLRLRSWEYHMAVANLLNLPLMFTSTALYPQTLMPDWMKPLATLNPLTHTIELVRSALLYGNSVDLAAYQFHLAYLSAFALLAAGLGSYAANRFLSAER